MFCYLWSVILPERFFRIFSVIPYTLSLVVSIRFPPLSVDFPCFDHLLFLLQCSPSPPTQSFPLQPFFFLDTIRFSRRFVSLLYSITLFFPQSSWRLLDIPGILHFPFIRWSYISLFCGLFCGGRRAFSPL